MSLINRRSFLQGATAVAPLLIADHIGTMECDGSRWIRAETHDVLYSTVYLYGRVAVPGHNMRNAYQRPGQFDVWLDHELQAMKQEFNAMLERGRTRNWPTAEFPRSRTWLS